MVGALEMVGDVEGSIEGWSVGESVGDTLFRVNEFMEWGKLGKVAIQHLDEPVLYIKNSRWGHSWLNW